MSSPQAFWNRRTLVVAAILSIAAFIGIASVGTTADEDAPGPAGPDLAPVVSPLGVIERLDHSTIRSTDAMEPDAPGASVAAYGM